MADLPIQKAGREQKTNWAKNWDFPAVPCEDALWHATRASGVPLTHPPVTRPDEMKIMRDKHVEIDFILVIQPAALILGFMHRPK